MTAYIPKHRVERKGVIKGYNLEYSVEDILKYAEAPCKILHARRLNQRRKNLETGKTEWTPSGTVQITVEGTTLPDTIKIYGLYHMKVDVYIEPTKICYNCLRFGHIAKYCRSNKRCINCNQTEQHNQEICNSKETKCFHCGGEHKTLHPRCPKVAEEKEINKIISYQNVNPWEARRLLKATQGNQKSQTTAPQLIKENFPPLKTMSPKEIMKMK